MGCSLLASTLETNLSLWYGFSLKVATASTADVHMTMMMTNHRMILIADLIDPLHLIVP